MFSDLVFREACQCNSKQDIISGKGMVVQQDFEKGRSQRLWFRRYDRYKNLPFFQGLTLGAEGGGGGLVRGTLRYIAKI